MNELVESLILSFYVLLLNELIEIKILYLLLKIEYFPILVQDTFEPWHWS